MNALPLPLDPDQTLEKSFAALASPAGPIAEQGALYLSIKPGERRCIDVG